MKYSLKNDLSHNTRMRYPHFNLDKINEPEFYKQTTYKLGNNDSSFIVYQQPVEYNSRFQFILELSNSTFTHHR